MSGSPIRRHAIRRSHETQYNGEVVELSVDHIGAQGDGIAYWHAVPVFLAVTAPGDRVRAVLGGQRGSGREGRVIAHLVSGPGHAEPVCRHFERCGGCALQHLGDAAYRMAKLGTLHAALLRVGIDPAIVAPLRTVPPVRRRARLGLYCPAKPGTPAVVGFRERFRRTLVDVDECPVLEPALFALTVPVRAAASQFLRPGMSANVSLTRTDSGVDMLVEADDQPGIDALEALAQLAKDHDLARIVWRVRGEDTPIVERRPARILMSGVPVAYPPGGFLQASAAVERILTEEVTAAIGPRRPVLDLFAGLGTFALPLAAAGPVHAVEGDARAAEALALATAHMPQVTVERRDLERDPLPAEALARYAAAVFDPPRAGARRQVIQLAASGLETIVAVSCNPATFVRDAAALIAGGFRIEKILPIDQFTWSPHLELLAVFSR